MGEPAEGVEVVASSDGEGCLPLVIRALEGKDSLDYLKTWMAANKSWLEEKMVQHGAILLKGFNIDSGADFQSAIQQYSPELCDEYRGTSPRKLVPGTDYVFTASELPPFYPIPQHLEMSFLPSPPRQLFFCCLEPPSSAGGETCLCDYKKVYQQLDPDIRKEFVEKGVTHIRNYTQKKEKRFLSDPTMMKGWEDVFGTESREKVSEELEHQELDYVWKENADLQVINKTAAVEKHPVTGDTIWFNHLMVFHWSMLYQEYYRVWRRLGGLKFLLLSAITWLLSCFFLNVLGRNRVGMHTEFGDGSSIPNSTIVHVRDVVWKNLVFKRWEKGDILMIDNFRVSHGRQPYTGKRKIVVSWSPPMKRPSMNSK